MFEQMIARVPERWREVAELVAAPIAWIPRMQEALLTFFLESPSTWMAVLKLVFLLFPVLLGVAAVWCTQLALYTLPFRFFSHLRRDHRKILAVDGEVAFVGGLNLTAHWAPKGVGEGWRDDVLKVEGPAAAQLERTFCASWRMQVQERLRGWRRRRSTALARVGDVAQVQSARAHGSGRGPSRQAG